jgi:hypothetical protein
MKFVKSIFLTLAATVAILTSSKAMQNDFNTMPNDLVKIIIIENVKKEMAGVSVSEFATKFSEIISKLKSVSQRFRLLVSRNLEQICTEVLNDKANIRLITGNLLGEAASRGHLFIIKCLLSDNNKHKRFNIQNITNKQGYCAYSPLELTILINRLDIVTYLLHKLGYCSPENKTADELLEIINTNNVQVSEFVRLQLRSKITKS